MERASLNYMDYFEIGEGAVSLTEQGKEFAGNARNTARSRGAMLAGMAVHVMNRIDQDTSAVHDADKSVFLYGTVMEQAADAAQPPLPAEDREQFMAGARQVLLGGTE
jgi:hypothetical protein